MNHNEIGYVFLKWGKMDLLSQHKMLQQCIRLILVGAVWLFFKNYNKKNKLKSLFYCHLYVIAKLYVNNDMLGSIDGIEARCHFSVIFTWFHLYSFSTLKCVKTWFKSTILQKSMAGKIMAIPIRRRVQRYPISVLSKWQGPRYMYCIRCMKHLDTCTHTILIAILINLY